MRARVVAGFVLAPTLALGAVDAPRVASGPERGAPAPPAEAVTKTVHVSSTAGRWYGGQILIVDGAAVTLIAIGALSRVDQPVRGSIVVAGFAGYLLGPPLVHVLHGNVGKAFGSFGARYFLPGLGVMLGITVGQCWADSRCNGAPAVAGGLAGLGAALVLDVGVMAFERAPKPRPAGTRITPTLAPSRNGLTLGVAGGF
jgi:hypothetical protein